MGDIHNRYKMIFQSGQSQSLFYQMFILIIPVFQGSNNSVERGDYDLLMGMALAKEVIIKN